MFRIWFDHKSGMFVVQVLRFYAVWQTVQMELVDRELRPRRFANYAEADKWVETAGLRHALKETRPTASWWAQFVYGEMAK